MSRLDLYAWDTPNGEKPTLLLEELGVEYTLHGVNIGEGEQESDAFLSINPNGRIPALMDRSGDSPVRLFDSGAILVHLAEKYDRFLPSEYRGEVLSWCFWQVGHLGPMLGQYGHFLMRDEKIEYAIDRYAQEGLRLLRILEEQLRRNDFLAGPDYTIADMMCWGWARGGMSFLKRRVKEEVDALEHVRAWTERIGERPAAQRTREKLAALTRS